MNRWDKDLVQEYQKLKAYHDALMIRCEEIRKGMKEILDEMEKS